MEPDERTLTEFGHHTAGAPRAGKYRIVGRIGQGGMGVVFRAIDDELGRAVALKFIPPHLADNPTAEQRFLREARAASALDHVNIGVIHGVEETEDHRRFIVMAYYEGLNLSERMKQEDNPLTAGEAISIAAQVARGLDEAHRHGVIHRDVKPSNILITLQGIVKIVDFGLASMAEADQITQAGARMGTPAYMSPEQALGEPTDHRSDIWSLGVVMYELLTRRRHFESNSIPAVLFKVVHGPLPEMGSLPLEMGPVVERALQRDPARRYQSMGELLADLEPIAQETRALTAAVPVIQKSKRAGGVLKRLAARRWAAAAVFVVVGAAGFAVWKWNSGRDKGPDAIAVAAPSAYEDYLKGIEYLKRWDKEGNLDQAIALFSNSTSLDPKFALGYARLAEAQRIRFALSRDKAWLEKATASATEALRLNAGLSPVQVAAGRVHAMRGNNDLAFASFEYALRLDPNDAEAHQAIARQYERLGRHSDAEASYQRALALDPESISIHDSFANYLFRQSRHQEAAREFQAVIRLAPDNAAALVNLGSALSESGNIAEAITMFERAVEVRPSYMAYTNLGTAYSRAARFREAVDAYTKALEITSTDHMVWGNLAFVYSWMGGMDERSVKTFHQAVKLGEEKRKDSPRDPYVHSDLALYYAKLSNQQLALQRLETALALSPKTPEIQAAAAEANEILGRRPEAIRFVRTAVDLGYSRPRLQRNHELQKLLKDPSLRLSP